MLKLFKYCKWRLLFDFLNTSSTCARSNWEGKYLKMPPTPKQILFQPRNFRKPCSSWDKISLPTEFLAVSSAKTFNSSTYSLRKTIGGRMVGPCTSLKAKDTTTEKEKCSITMVMDRVGTNTLFHDVRKLYL